MQRSSPLLSKPGASGKQFHGPRPMWAWDTFYRFGMDITIIGLTLLDWQAFHKFCKINNCPSPMDRADSKGLAITDPAVYQQIFESSVLSVFDKSITVMALVSLPNTTPVEFLTVFPRAVLFSQNRKSSSFLCTGSVDDWCDSLIMASQAEDREMRAMSNDAYKSLRQILGSRFNEIDAYDGTYQLCRKSSR